LSKNRQNSVQLAKKLAEVSETQVGRVVITGKMCKKKHTYISFTKYRRA